MIGFIRLHAPIIHREVIAALSGRTSSTPVIHKFFMHQAASVNTFPGFEKLTIDFADSAFTELSTRKAVI
jgi:hypothetical protein